MKFSILVPVYNVEKYLEQCVESLINQTYTGDYEIILVDDGSTDSSGKICDGYAENHPDKVRVIHKENQGLVSARQVGIENAIGEYSLFVDSDDFVELDLLETVDECINRNDSPDMVIYSFCYYSNRKTSYRKVTLSETEKVFSEINKNELYEALIFTTHITSLGTKAVKTTILKKDLTDYSLYYDKNMAEDLFRSIPLLTFAEKIIYINNHLYNYRTNESSISRSYRPETIKKKNTLYVYKKILEFLPLWDMNDDEHIQKLNARWLNETMYTFTNYYEHVVFSDRKAVLNFDWSTMIPIEAQTDTNNPYENKVYRKLYTLLMKKKFFHIRFFFAKKKAKKFLRKLLKRGI